VTGERSHEKWPNARQGSCAELVQLPEILVVDDSKVMRDMIVACLRPRADLTFTHASSGLEAIERLSLKPFDLVVLDLNMPDIGGIEVLEFVRGQDKLRWLPIVIVTTRGDDASRTRALQAGASSYMTKPFTPDAILDQVARLLLGSGAPH
jgi:two-component system, chemotaxis family, chemotaxis protein CheY